MAVVARWLAGVALLALLVAVPFVDFRAEYAHHKRLRVVAPDVLYRSGQLTAQGFRDAVAHYHIRTVINAQNEFPDPDLPRTFWDRHSVRECELCRDLGVRYVHLDPDLAPDRTNPVVRPLAIDEFLKLVDDASARPILLHCKAGLHRTGLLAAVYHMEYEGWGPHRALAELKAHGFGDIAATAANDYVQQYILNYRPRRLTRGSQQAADTRHETRDTRREHFSPFLSCLVSRVSCLVSSGSAP